MQVKFINKETLETKIINIKGGTLPEILDEAETVFNDFDKTILKQNGDILLLKGYYADILYHGTPKSEQNRGRQPLDWTDKIEQFNNAYNENITAAELASNSGLSLSHVYYLSSKLNKTLKAATRGRRKK